MADPLSLLRQYTIDYKQVIERYNNIIFGEHSFPKTVKTNYVIYGTTNEFYTLECLLYFIKKRNLQHPKYVTQADRDGVPFIRRPDRKDLLLYLRGKINCSPSIVKQEKRTGDDTLEIVKQEKRTGDDALEIVKQEKRTGDDTLEIVKQEKRTGDGTLEKVSTKKPRTDDVTLKTLNDLLLENCCQDHEESSTATAVKEESTTN